MIHTFIVSTEHDTFLMLHFLRELLDLWLTKPLAARSEVDLSHFRHFSFFMLHFSFNAHESIVNRLYLYQGPRSASVGLIIDPMLRLAGEIPEIVEYRIK